MLYIKETGQFESCTMPNTDMRERGQCEHSYCTVQLFLWRYFFLTLQSLLKLLFPLVFVTTGIPSNGTASVGHKMKIHDVKRVSLEDIMGRMLQCARKQELRQLIIRWLEQSFMHSVKSSWKYPRLLYSVCCVYIELIFRDLEHALLFVYNCF